MALERRRAPERDAGQVLKSLPTRLDAADAEECEQLPHVIRWAGRAVERTAPAQLEQGETPRPSGLRGELTLVFGLGEPQPVVRLHGQPDIGTHPEDSL